MMKKLVVKALQIPIRLYQLMISPWLPRSCRFYQSCSAYTMEALEKHGPIKGLWLGIKRISKCHPYSKAPYDDPVP